MLAPSRAGRKAAHPRLDVRLPAPRHVAPERTFESFVAKLAAFGPVELPVPTIEVDTSLGLDPGLEVILRTVYPAEDRPG